MMKNTPSLDLVAFVETQILPQYAAFDRAHNLQHANSVIRASIALARRLGADLDMAYVVAAYHDLGLRGPRAVHHMESGRILIQDVRLRRWFTPDQLQLMKEAVEDHRASASRAPRNLYGKIVAEADRDLRPETVVRRTIQFGLAHYAHLDREGHWQRLLQHMDEKYAAGGYIRLWVQGSENEHHLQQLRALIASPGELRPLFDRIFDEEKTTLCTEK